MRVSTRVQQDVSEQTSAMAVTGFNRLHDKKQSIKGGSPTLPAFYSPEFGANCGPCCILDLPKNKKNVRNESDRLTY